MKFMICFNFDGEGRASEFDQFMGDLSSWKKELSPVDIGNAFDEWLDRMDPPPMKVIEMNLAFDAIIKTLFPVEEFEEFLSKKGDEDGK